jgi:purine-binding chemotaxis protein CheW
VSTAGKTSQYLTFRLDDEMFALDIAKVREVLEFSSITRVPRTPDFMRGVINLRGNVVPVVDLKLKLGLARTEKTIDTCVVITEVELDGERTVLGALADSVQEVVELDASQIDPPPRMGTRIDTSSIRGMGKRDDEFLIILDIDRVLTTFELGAVRGASSAGGGISLSLEDAA